MIAIIAILFIFVGRLNDLAPMVTMPFLTTYATINYAYFAMSMSFDIKAKRHLFYKNDTKNYGAVNSDLLKRDEQVMHSVDSNLLVADNTEKTFECSSDLELEAVELYNGEQPMAVDEHIDIPSETPVDNSGSSTASPTKGKCEVKVT